MPREAQTRKVRTKCVPFVRPDRLDQLADIVRAIAMRCFVPAFGPAERCNRLAGPATTAGIAMIRCKDEITRRGKRFHEKARLRGATVQPVRKNDHRL